MENAALKNLAIKLEERRVKAMIDGDINALETLFAEELYYGHTGGYVDNKTSFLEKIKSGVYSYESIKTQVDNVKAIGETGLNINGELTIEVNSSGEKKIFHAIYLAIWRLEVDTWKLLSLQAAFKK